jgi:hypothetical protein
MKGHRMTITRIAAVESRPERAGFRQGSPANRAARRVA